MYIHVHTDTYDDIKSALPKAYLAGVLETLGSHALPPCEGVRDGS